MQFLRSLFTQRYPPDLSSFPKCNAVEFTKCIRSFYLIFIFYIYTWIYTMFTDPRAHRVIVPALWHLKFCEHSACKQTDLSRAAETRRWTNFGRNRRVHKSLAKASKNFKVCAGMGADKIFLRESICRKSCNLPSSLFFTTHEHVCIILANCCIIFCGSTKLPLPFT